MTGWLVNDKLTAIPGTTTFWHHLLASIPGLLDRTTGTFEGLANKTEAHAEIDRPDYIIRNAAYFRSLEVDCPVISFVQDIMHGKARDVLADACNNSDLVAFNSEYTLAAYPELHANAVIPIGTDDAVFSPKEPDGSIPCHAVLWIGSSHNIKGFDLACHLAENSPRPWIFVMKDDAEVPCGSKVFHKISQEQIAMLASSCAVGACTSREETQHLAGIEMGMCGLPLVTTDVGVYHGRETGDWGTRVQRDWHSDIEAAASLDREAVRKYWIEEGFGLDACMSAWRGLVASLEPAHVVR